MLAFVEAVGAIDLAERDHVYWAGRTTLVRRPEDRQVYDRAFAAAYAALDYAKSEGDGLRGPGGELAVFDLGSTPLRAAWM